MLISDFENTNKFSPKLCLFGFIGLAVLIHCSQSFAQAQASQALNSITVIEKKIASSLTMDLEDQSWAKSVLSNFALTEIATPMADFGSLANLTPSFVSSAPNGIGFDAAKNMSLRGFTDGQFNVTMDGIPLQDPDTFKHHSTSFFPVGSLDHLSVDRSPGTGSSLGYSTLGGSLNMFSVNIPKASETSVYGAIGSFGTQLAGVKFNTPNPGVDEHTAYLINAESMRSNGALSYASGQKSDLLFKSVSQFGELKLTALISLDAYQFNNPPSVTTTQIAQSGTGAGFNANPLDPNFFGDSSTTRNTDFEYLKQSYRFNPNIELQNTLYTYAYMSDGLGINGDPTSSKIGTGFGVNPNDIAGNATYNSYRTKGDVLAMDFKTDEPIETSSKGLKAARQNHLKFGLWMEESHQNEYRQALDLVTQQSYPLNKLSNNATLYAFNDQLRTIQPFIDAQWHLDDRWMLQSGVRYQKVDRSLNGITLPTSLPGTNGVIGKSVSSTLPSLETHYDVDSNHYAYAQWSKGAIVPLLSYFNSSTPMLSNQAAPETGVGVQMGWNWHTKDSLLNIDAYKVDLQNYFSKVVVSGNTEFINNGAVSYKGIEAEGHQRVNEQIDFFANASLIKAQFETNAVTSATQKAGDTLSFAPNYLGLMGLIYQSGSWSGNFTTKFVGGQYQGKNGSSDGVNYFVPAYNYSNLSIYKFIDNTTILNEIKLGLSISNLFNHTSITDTAGPSVAGPLLVNVLSPRSFFLSLNAKL
jgi:iron complex outermembrane receptor protein